MIERAVSVVSVVAEARRLGHNYVGTEQLLLVATDDPDVRRRTLRWIGRGDARPGQVLRLTTKVAVRHARRAALRRGSWRVRERDVLAGLVQDGHGAAAIVLSGRDVELLAED